MNTLKLIGHQTNKVGMDEPSESHFINTPAAQSETSLATLTAAAEETSRESSPTLEVGEAASTKHGKAVWLIGLDWGTNTSCLVGSRCGSTERSLHRHVPTVVGYAKKGIVPDLLPGNARILFGAEALKHRLHLRLVQPMVHGVLSHLASSRDFARHLRSLISAPVGCEIRAVVGVPANADTTARENIRQAVAGVFDRVIFIPEPFLAALGYRDETRLGKSDYVDPVKNSLFVDIGAGTTDVCLVQGCYPTAEDQISYPFAGDRVDALLAEAIKKTYPDCDPSLLKVREIKETYSFVAASTQPVVADVMVGGKVRRLDLTEQIASSCRALLSHILEVVKTLIGRSSSDSVTDLLQNIILTGGGSRIRDLAPELQRLLAEEGYEKPRVNVVGENYKEFVAHGAWKAARHAQEDQWQHLLTATPPA